MFDLEKYIPINQNVHMKFFKYQKNTPVFTLKKFKHKKF